MVNASQVPLSRWIILAAVLLISLYAWKQPFQRDPPVPSQSMTEMSNKYPPPKIYESERGQFGGQTIGKAIQKITKKPPENDKAPSFPAFKTSADHLSSQLYNPYPDYNSRIWRRKWKGTHVACQGPRGVDVNGNVPDTLKAYKQDVAHASPDPMFGSYEETGLDDTFCFDRFARYEAYGYDEDTPDQTAKVKRDGTIDWKMVDWGSLQYDCLSRNENRYESIERANHTEFWMPRQEDFADVDDTLHFPAEFPKGGWLSSSASFKKRSAVVLHMNAGKEWTVDTMQYIRSIIQEVSLHSGAEYEVIILAETKDSSKPLFIDTGAYRVLLKNSVPDEFAGHALLFNRALVDTWYPKIEKHSDDKNVDMMQTLQLLSILRPDIEHFWQMEMDARYTGHHYQHLETMSAWSKAQPRRLLWERSSQYFFPAVHRDWTGFSTIVENATADGGIWGPVRTEGVEAIGPDPPVEPSQLDDYHWGVGEDADLITVAPIVDATSSDSLDETLNYPAGAAQTPSRMTSHSSISRFSKRLLRAMHHGQMALGTYMPANKYPASTALHHGLKAVAFPLPIFLDYAKPPVDVEREFNSNGGRDVYEAADKFEETGHRMTSFSSKDKQTNFADELYKRWLGYGRDPNERLCLPGIFLHSITGV